MRHQTPIQFLQERIEVPGCSEWLEASALSDCDGHRDMRTLSSGGGTGSVGLKDSLSIRRQWYLCSTLSQSIPLWHGNKSGKDPSFRIGLASSKLPCLPRGRELERLCHNHQTVPSTEKHFPGVYFPGCIQLHRTFRKRRQPYSLSKRSLLSFKLQNVKKRREWSIRSRSFLRTSRPQEKRVLAGNLSSSERECLGISKL